MDKYHISITQKTIQRDTSNNASHITAGCDSASVVYCAWLMRSSNYKITLVSINHAIHAVQNEKDTALTDFTVSELRQMDCETALLLLVINKYDLSQPEVCELAKKGLDELRAGKISWGLRNILQLNYIRLEYLTLADIDKVCATYLNQPYSVELAHMALQGLSVKCDKDRFISEVVLRKLKEEVDSIQPITHFNLPTDDNLFALLDLSEADAILLPTFADRMAKYLGRVVFVQAHQKIGGGYYAISVASYLDYPLHSVMDALKIDRFISTRNCISFALTKRIKYDSLQQVFFANTSTNEPQLLPGYKSQTIVKKHTTPADLKEEYLKKPYGYGNMPPIFESRFYLNDYYSQNNSMVLKVESQAPDGSNQFDAILYNSDRLRKDIFKLLGKKITIRYTLKIIKNNLQLMVVKIV